MASRALRHLDGELAELARAGLLRAAGNGERPDDAVVLCSNDYLGFAGGPWGVGSTAPGGAGASRLVCGDYAVHARAERALAEWVGAEAALLFSSGYAANVGALAALARPGDLVVSDALNHASIVDGCRLSGARIQVVAHRDNRAVAAALGSAQGSARRWVVTESYFSMDGDSPDLVELRRICDEHDAALFVDEAHAVGVFGPEGAGRCAELGVRPDVLVGALGKAVGLQGAFVAGDAPLRRWLWNRARSFVFSTGVSPALADRVEARVAEVRCADERRARLAEVTRALREALAQGPGDGGPGGQGPILPWVVGEAEAAVALATALRVRGVWAQAIRPPTVPRGTARLRLTASAALVDRQLGIAVRSLREVVAR
jgi:8-amino-7-oxononanoate synthase